MRTIINTSLLKRQRISGQRINEVVTYPDYEFAIEQRSLGFTWQVKKQGLLTYSSSGAYLGGFKTFQSALEDLQNFAQDFPSLPEIMGLKPRRLRRNNFVFCSSNL